MHTFTVNWLDENFLGEDNKVSAMRLGLNDSNLYAIQSFGRLLTDNQKKLVEEVIMAYINGFISAINRNN